MLVTIFQDGKLCRGINGTVIKRASQRILIEFSIDKYIQETDKYETETTTRWFKRRSKEKGGIYECEGLNYWYYGRP